MQKKFIIFLIPSILILSLFLSEIFYEKDVFELYLEKSGPYIGIESPALDGFAGNGIKIAVIDTGVDYNHPDLLGFGKDGKVLDGYDFVENDNSPIDTNGHGTEVAGIIAADGNLKGIAPKSKILAYRVSDDGESVPSELIIKAINRAIEDKADVINISLGINKTNKRIDDAVNSAIDHGIVVVTAAGNSGPQLATIGSPGINPNSITVGASYNNVSSSLVSTFEIGEERFQVLPMIGTTPLEEPISAKIMFGIYGRQKDLAGINAEDAILLVERGSDLEDEIVYFSDKEKNAADAGAKAILVYNNNPGIFLGELVHDLAGPDYYPRIPSLSMSQEDGMKIRELLSNKTEGRLNIFYNPDFVAHFSSRGPVSPFYIKPDLVAPGAFVNTTLAEGKYNFTSGTSFAAPHVSGAAALLLQKDKGLDPSDIKSLIVTTADPVSDAYGNQFPYEIGGTGRINVTKAFAADLVIKPTFLIFNLSPENPTEEKSLKLKSFTGDRNSEVYFQKNDEVVFSHKIENDSLKITASMKKENFGEHSNKLTIEHNGISYYIPIIVRITESSITVEETDGRLNFGIFHPEEWSYAKISVINKETGKADTTSATPTKLGTMMLNEPGVYWIETKITSNGNTFDVYNEVEVNSVSTTAEFDIFDFLKIPQRPIIIVFAVIGIIILVGIKVRR